MTLFIDTENGTAQAPGDFVSGGHSVEFSSGQSSGVASIQLKQDTVLEADETFTVKLAGTSKLDSHLISATAATATVTIKDDEPYLILSPKELAIDEGGDDKYSVRLGTKPDASVTVSVRSDSGKVLVIGAPLTFTTGNWNIGQTVTVLANEDDDRDNDTVKLINTAGSEYGSASDSVSVTVTDNDIPGVTLSTLELTVVEGQTGVYTVVLDTLPDGSVTITPQSGVENVATVSAALTFSTGDWSTAQTVTVTGEQDADGINGTAEVSNAVAGYESVTADAVSVKVVDDDKALTLSVSELTIGEGGTGTYTVKLAALPASSVTVTVSSDSAEVTVSKTELTFTTSNWSTEQTVTATVEQDDDAADDAVTFSHAAGSEYDEVSADLAVTVADDDAALTLSVSELTVDEGESGSGTYTVQLAALPATSVTVTVSSDSAEVTVSQTTLTFSTLNWSTAQTVTVTGLEDNDAIDDVATLSNVAGSEYDEVIAGVAVTVQDDDEALTLSVSELTVDEGESGKDTYTVQLAALPATSVTVTVSNKDPAKVMVSKTELTFSTLNWSTAQTVTVTGLGDDDANNEMVTLRHVAGSEYGSVSADVDVMVKDNTVHLKIADVSAAEGSGVFNFAVSLNLPLSVDMTFDYEVAAVGTDTATAGDDFTVAEGTMTLTANATALTIAVMVNNDELHENDETFTVSISNESANIIVTDRTAKGIIRNDDNPPTVRIVGTNDTDGGDDDTEVTEGDSGTTPIEFKVILSKPGALVYSVSYEVRSGGTAVRNTDYRFDDGKLTFEAEASGAALTKVITGQVIGDELDENDTEVFTVELTELVNAEPYRGVGSGVSQPAPVNQRAFGIIKDDDATPVLKDLSDVTVIYDPKLEMGDEVNIEAIATDADGDTITYTWTRDVTETRPDLPDGTVLNQARLRFKPTELGTYSMTVTASDDNGNSAEESLKIKVQTRLPDMVSMPAELTVAENARSAEVTAKVSKAFGEQVVFDVIYGGDAIGSTNRNNGDYSNALTKLTFDANDREAVITIRIYNDRVDEEDKTIQVRIAVSGTLPEGYELGNAITAVILKDDDTAGVTVSPHRLEVTEGGSIEYTVVLTSQPTESVVLEVNVDGATSNLEISGAPPPLLLTFSVSDWNTAQTVTVTELDDTEQGEHEEVMLTHTAMGGGYNLVDIDPVSLKVIDNETAGVAVSPRRVEVTEGRQGFYTVVLTRKPEGDVTVTPLSDDVPNDPQVARLLTDALTFTTGNWDTAQTVTVEGVDNDVDELNEGESNNRIRVTHEVSGYGDVVSASAVRVTALNNDTAGVMVSELDLTVAEGDNGTYTVVLNSEPRSTVEVKPKSNSPGVVDVSGALNFTPNDWSTPQTVTVTGLQNDNADGDGIATVRHAVKGYGSVVAKDVGKVTVRVKDDDTVGVKVVPLELTVAEGATNTYTVVLTTKPGGNVTVTPSSDTESVATVFPPSLRFTTGDWNTAQTVTVTGEDNGVDAVNPSVSVTHEIEGVNVVLSSIVSVSVTDDDESPALNALNNKVTLKLGQAIDITAEATDGDGDAVSYIWTRKGGETPALPNDVVLPLNAARLNFTPTAVGTYTMTVTASDVYGNSDDETVEIEVTPAVAVSVPVSLSVNEDGVSAEVAVTTAEAFGKALTFSVSYGGTSATGASTAANGDYGNAVTSVEFSATDTTKSIVIPITDDTLDEDDETFTVTIELAGGSTLPAGFTLGNAMTTVTITDNDDLSITWTLSVDPSSVNESESATKVKVTARRDGTATSTVSTTIAVSVTDGTATEALDFLEVSDFNITVAAGEPSGESTFTLTTIDDNIYETDETITVSGMLAGNTIPPISITITEDGDKPELSISAPVAVAEGDSGNTNMIFTVTLDNQSGRQTTVSYAVDASSTASAVSDYTDLSGMLTFDAGTTEEKITVTIMGDELDEKDETVVIELSNAVNASIADPATASGTITDDDASPELGVIPATQIKRAGQLVSITASATDTDGDTIGYAWTRKVGETTPALPNNTALNQAHLSFTPTQVGTYSMTVTASDGNQNKDTATVVITVISAKTVAMPAAFTVSESVGTANVNVVTGTAFGRQVIFNVNYGGTATGATNVNDGDYGNAVTLLTFESGQTENSISIPINDDNLNEPDETIEVTIQGSLPDGFTLGNSTTTVTVMDNDADGVTVSESELTIAEGGTGTYTVVLKSEPTGSVTVTPTSGDMAVATVAPALTFTTSNWLTAQTVTVTSVDNDIDTPQDGTATVRHAVVGYGSVTASSVTVSVTDDDTAGVTVSGSPLTVGEGETRTYTVKLDTKPLGSVTVTPTSDTSAVATVSGALTFTTGNWSTAQTVTVTGAQDDDGNAGTASVTHAATGGGYGLVIIGAVMVNVTDDDAVTASVSELTVAEGASNTYTVVLTSKPAGSVTVTPNSADTDVAAVSGVMTFTTSNWSTAQTVTVRGVENEVVSGTGIAAVTHLVTGYGTVTANSVTVTVTNNDKAGVTVNGSPVEVTEGLMGSYTIALNKQPTGNVVVMLSIAPTTVATVSAALTFTTGNWLTAQTVTVTSKHDDDGTDGTATVTHSATGGGYGTVNIARVTVNVTDDDAVRLSKSELTVAEGGAGNYTVVLGSQPTGSVTVTPTSRDTAVATVSAALTFTTGNWSTEQTVTVTAKENNVAGGPGSATVTHGVQGYGTVTAGSVTVTVTDNDTAGVTVSKSDLTMPEDGSGTYTVVLNSQPTGNVTVKPSSDPSAVVTVSGALIFGTGNWSTAQTVTVTAKENNVAGVGGSAIVSHQVQGYGTVTTANPVAVTVTDNDTLSTSWTLSADPSSVSESSDATTVTVTATRSGTVTAATSTTVSVSVGDGTAKAGEDFIAASSFDLTVAAEATSGEATVRLAVIDDSVDEEDETVAVSGTLASNTITGTNITITDDDASPVLAAIDPVSKRVGQLVSVKARATDADNDTITYAWTRKAGETAPALPTTPLDKATLTFTPTEAGTYTMTVTASDGNGNEATETVVITVTSGNSVSVPSTMTVAEAAGNAEIAITTTAAFGKALTFSVSYGGTSATGAPEPADGDYDNDEVASVAFSATDTTIKITVPITDDTLDENDETFTVTIELAGGSELPAGFTLGNAMTTVTITDDDTLSTSWTLSAVPSTVTEVSGTTAVKVTATRAGTATAATTTTLSISVAGVTAAAGTDFEVVTDFEITVATGATSGEASFNLVVIDDNVDESDETVAVRGTLAGSDFNGATITVTDNDEAGLTVTGSPVAVAEGSTGTYTVALDSQPTGSVTVTPTSGDTAVATVAPALTFTTGNWSTAQTVTVTGVQDDDGVNDSTSVTHTVSGGGYGSVDVSDVTVNVTDDDGVTVSVSELTVAEGANNTYTVVLTSEPGGSVTVTPSSGATLVATVSGALTFTTGSWSTAQTVTVTAKENNVADVGGSAIVSHAVTGYGTVTTANPVAVTVTNNDTLSTSWTLSADPSSVSESSDATTVTVTATRSGTVTAATSTTVSVSVGDGTAKAVEDFTAVSSFDLTVAAEATSGEATFRLAVIDDSVDEEDETIAVSGTLASNTITGTNITITDDDASPVLAAIDPVSKRVGQLVSVEARATDADNDRSHTLGLGRLARPRRRCRPRRWTRRP